MFVLGKGSELCCTLFAQFLMAVGLILPPEKFVAEASVPDGQVKLVCVFV